MHDTPVAAWMPSGRAVTYNGAHLDVDAELPGDDGGAGVAVHSLVDDVTASIATWVTAPG